jgi:hypothetical protein
MNTERFKDKIMVVTGGTSGIGKAVCIRAGAEGATVVIAGRNEERGKAIEKTITDQGGKALFVRCDVTIKEDIIALYAKVMEVYGRIDIAINNAGIVGDSKKIEDLTDEDWFSVVNANLNAMFYCIREEVKYMLTNETGGSIVNTASVAGIRACLCCQQARCCRTDKINGNGLRCEKHYLQCHLSGRNRYTADRSRKAEDLCQDCGIEGTGKRPAGIYEEFHDCR